MRKLWIVCLSASAIVLLIAGAMICLNTSPKTDDSKHPSSSPAATNFSASQSPAATSPIDTSRPPTIKVRTEHSLNLCDSDGLTADQKQEAEGIALSVPSVRAIMDDRNAGSRTERILPASPEDRSGYIGSSLHLVNVTVVYKKDTGESQDVTINNITHPFGRLTFDRALTALVDLNDSRVMSLTDYELASLYDSKRNMPIPVPPGSYYQYEPSNKNAIIPPGVSWYAIIEPLGSYWREYEVTLTQGPEDIPVYMALLNETNFRQFRNGTSYEVLPYIDSGTNTTRYSDANTPVKPGTIGRISPYDENFYLVLKNGDDEREVSINVKF